ncbi:arsenate reductase/protein-tyrosine-phosphatase family protein [Burkholderia sp. Ac-20379]|uniref:arsenate reductase/protein-tyrosine-phosphatase family protein n=1 Tax=Burkholderia sp. Ac-20379 TaxID=2703900 RepID=UPI001F11CBE0|nr:hypothetical protein [Burkholderia sp. Ac-20379]
MDTLLVMCTANVCRSPMAAALFARALPGVRVWSAGVEAMPGLPPDPLAAECMRALGLEIGAHRSQALAQWMLEAASLVLTMSERQRRAIVQRYPTATGRVYRLLDEDVADPYRRGPAAYRAALERLQDGVERWSRRVTRLPSGAASGSDSDAAVSAAAVSAAAVSAAAVSAAAVSTAAISTAAGAPASAASIHEAVPTASAASAVFVPSSPFAACAAFVSPGALHEPL